MLDFIVIAVLLFCAAVFIVPAQVEKLCIGEIIEAYGEPEFKFPNRYGYYVGEDNGFFGVMGSNSGIYYYIIFDENGIAESAEKGGPIGG